MFTNDRRDCALGLPRKALDELYAIPARAYIEKAGGEVRTNAPARIVVDGRPAVFVRDEAFHPRAVICAVAWYSLSSVFVPAPDGLAGVLAAADATSSSPIVTVNLWFDRPVTGDAFVGLPGRAMQWVFDKRALYGDESSHLSLVSSGATSLVGRENREIVRTCARAKRQTARVARIHRAAMSVSSVSMDEQWLCRRIAPRHPLAARPDAPSRAAPPLRWLPGNGDPHRGNRPRMSRNASVVSADGRGEAEAQRDSR